MRHHYAAASIVAVAEDGDLVGEHQAVNNESAKCMNILRIIRARYPASTLRQCIVQGSGWQGEVSLRMSHACS